MEVRLLGPLQLVQDGAVQEVRGAGERALLALLATAPARVFTKDGLIDALWGEAPPVNPDNALQSRVSKLRKVLGGALASVPSGYRLDIADDDVDAGRFAHLVAQRRFAEALVLWRGAPLAEFADRRWARDEAARLSELHATAVEEHVEERLAAGDHVSLVAELEGLVAAAPLRERLRGQQMLALYRCGRAADALAVFQAYRRLLNEELGIEPSADLRALEAGILREDASLGAPVDRSAGPSNLPTPLSSLIGRDTQLQRLQHLVASARLVTLTGPGGVGKTTLAVALARRAGEGFRDGLWFVPLAGVRNGAGLPDAVADVIGLADPDKESARRLVTAWLAPRRALLVLDNCEHLADPCATFVEQLLRAAGEDLRVVVTSREPLGVPGEVQVPVPPLDEPDAVRLFRERATSVNPEAVRGDDEEDIRRICERLDGMPLAIELAAARVKTLTPEQIAARLDDRFRLLTVGPRTAESRHRTLRATVDWSHDLLDVPQQALFRRLAVFPGGWTVEAAEAVCGGETAGEVLDLLGDLVDRSLVVAAHGRFRMLETIRAYADEQLREAGEHETTARRFTEFFTRFVEAAEPRLRGPQQAQWLARLRAEDANLGAAMTWARAHREGEPDAAVRLGGALGWYWYVGRQIDGRGFLRAALQEAGDAPGVDRARALQALSLAVRPVGCIVHPSAEGAHAAEESARLFEEADDAARAAISQLLVAVEGVAQRDATDHLALVDRARTTLSAHADTWGVALADFVEMEIRLHHGQIDLALAVGRRASSAFDALADDWGRSAVRLHLGYGLRIAGRLDEAEDVLARAVVLSRDGGLPNNLARALFELAEVELHRGDPHTAQPWLDQCEHTARDLGNDTLLALALLGRAGVCRLLGDTPGSAEQYRHALSLAARNDFTKGVARARSGLAAAHLDAGAVGEARDELAAARSLALQLGDASIEASVLEQLARVAAHDGDTGERDRFLREAERLRAAHERPRGMLEDRDASLAVTSTDR